MADKASSYFGYVIDKKKAGISKFMKDNYASEASNNINSNYDLFVSKYLYQDKDGTWRRTDNMWNATKNDDGTTTYTPKPPKKK